jgi:hypothetical protein
VQGEWLYLPQLGGWAISVFEGHKLLLPLKDELDDSEPPEPPEELICPFTLELMVVIIHIAVINVHYSHHPPYSHHRSIQYSLRHSPSHDRSQHSHLRSSQTESWFTPQPSQSSSVATVIIALNLLRPRLRVIQSAGVEGKRVRMTASTRLRQGCN